MSRLIRLQSQVDKFIFTCKLSKVIIHFYMSQSIFNVLYCKQYFVSGRQLKHNVNVLLLREVSYFLRVRCKCTEAFGFCYIQI